MVFLFTYLALLALLAVDCVRPTMSNKEICLLEKFSFTATNLIDSDDTYRISIDFSQDRLYAVGKGSTYVEDLSTAIVYETDGKGNCRSYGTYGVFVWPNCIGLKSKAKPIKTEHRDLGPSKKMKLNFFTMTVGNPNDYTFLWVTYTTPKGEVPIIRRDITDGIPYAYMMDDHSLDIPDPEFFQIPSSCRGSG